MLHSSKVNIWLYAEICQTLLATCGERREKAAFKEEPADFLYVFTKSVHFIPATAGRELTGPGRSYEVEQRLKLALTTCLGSRNVTSRIFS